VAHRDDPQYLQFAKFPVPRSAHPRKIQVRVGTAGRELSVSVAGRHRETAAIKSSTESGGGGEVQAAGARCAYLVVEVHGSALALGLPLGVPEQLAENAPHRSAPEQRHLYVVKPLINVTERLPLGVVSGLLRTDCGCGVPKLSQDATRGGRGGRDVMVGGAVLARHAKIRAQSGSAKAKRKKEKRRYAVCALASTPR